MNRALLAKLNADAALLGLVGSFYMNVAPVNLTKFGLITQRAHSDEPMKNATSHEVFTFIVQAVVQGSNPSVAIQAAQRIVELLHLQDLTITGYALMLMKRTEHVNYPDRDELNKEWHHRGGIYEVWVQPTIA